MKEVMEHIYCSTLVMVSDLRDICLTFVTRGNVLDRALPTGVFIDQEMN